MLLYCYLQASWNQLWFRPFLSAHGMEYNGSDTVLFLCAERCRICAISVNMAQIHDFHCAVSNRCQLGAGNGLAGVASAATNTAVVCGYAKPVQYGF